MEKVDFQRVDSVQVNFAHVWLLTIFFETNSSIGGLWLPISRPCAGLMGEQETHATQDSCLPISTDRISQDAQADMWGHHQTAISSFLDVCSSSNSGNWSPLWTWAVDKMPRWTSPTLSSTQIALFVLRKSILFWARVTDHGCGSGPFQALHLWDLLYCQICFEFHTFRLVS